jgi:malate synthase
MIEEYSTVSAEKEILTVSSSAFLGMLVREFTPSLETLLLNRKQYQKQYDAGILPDFPKETADIRNSEWCVAPIPDDIRDRRVEITGPPDRKMIINALNSGANVFMADFEDSLAPTWSNVLEGQQNLKDAVRDDITYHHKTKGLYEVGEDPAVLFVRPRGLHLSEAHFLFDGQRCSASLFDFGLFMWHNARYMVNNGKAPYFYLPKIEHYLEARWWNDVFRWTQEQLNIPYGTIRATVLIETLPAAFQLNEILWELRDHSAGLNCGRWDYIFSYIKTFRNHSDRVTPDRAQIGMSTPFMNAYSKAVIQVCHRRGAHAMGGMAAQIPIRGDEQANTTALSRVRADKKREVLAGHDGTWVAHPGLVNLARDIFDQHMPTENQIDHEHDDYVSDDQACLLEHPVGEITHTGLRQNVDVGLRYLSAWLRGQGCVPLYNLMEDTATAEISRTQIWQWLTHGASLSDGAPVTVDLLNKISSEIVEQNPELISAAPLFDELCRSPELTNFLTLPAYERIKHG